MTNPGFRDETLTEPLKLAHQPLPVGKPAMCAAAVARDYEDRLARIPWSVCHTVRVSLMVSLCAVGAPWHWHRYLETQNAEATEIPRDAEWVRDPESNWRQLWTLSLSIDIAVSNTLSLRQET